MNYQKCSCRDLASNLASAARCAFARFSCALAISSIIANLASGQNAAPGGGLEYSTVPDAEAWAEEKASTYAVESGNQDLADAIATGQVNVYPGNVSTGPAVSWRDPGQPATIIVQYTPDG